MPKYPFTFQDHFSQIGLSKDFGYSEHHESIFWTDQVCSKSSVQKSYEQLSIHEQVFLNEGSPVKVSTGFVSTAIEITVSLFSAKRVTKEMLYTVSGKMVYLH